MDIHTDVNITKFKQFARTENLAIDSSALGQFKFCPLSYFYKYVLCYTDEGDAVYFTWGNAVHKFYEIAEKKYKETSNIAISAVNGVNAAMAVWGNRKDPPVDSKFAFQTKARLSSVLLYLAKFWQKEKEENRFKVVQSEMPYIIQLPFGQWVTGKVDQILSEISRLFVRDFKTTSKKWVYYKRSLNPSDQFIGYVYAARELTKTKIYGAKVDVICTSKDDGPKINREDILYSEDQISEWLRGREQWAKFLDSCREQDNYPRNERNCSFCPFYDVCSTRGEAGQAFVLKSKFKNVRWDPLNHTE